MQRALIEKYRENKLKGKVQHIGICWPKIKKFNVEYLYEFTCEHLRQYILNLEAELNSY